jgi:MOSC domain-containing protein YiiM
MQRGKQGDPGYDVVMKVVSVNTSAGGIPKLPREKLHVSTAGLDGDGHDHESHRKPTQAVCMIDLEILESMTGEGYDLAPGALGENLTLEGARIQMCALGDRVCFSSGLELEITKVRTPCYVLDSISPELKRILWNRSGMYGKVLVEGSITTGDTLTIERAGSGERPALREVPAGSTDGATLLPWS